MAEIFGAVAAGIAVCHELSRLVVTIRKGIQTVQNARKDIADLLDETALFTNLYGNFLQHCNDNSKICRETASSIERLKVWAQRTIKSFKKLLVSVDALRLDTDYRYTFLQTLNAQVQWLFSTNTVKLLQASLSIARQNIECFSNLMCLEKLKEELDMLRNALANASERQTAERKFGMRLEDKIQSIEQLVGVTQSAHVVKTRKLKDEVVTMERLQTKNSNPKTAAVAATELFKVAEALNTYTEQVFLPRPPSQRGAGHSVPSGSTPTSRGSSEGLPHMMQSNQSSRSLSSSPIGTHFDQPSPASSFVRTSIARNQSTPGQHSVRSTMIPVRSEAVQITADDTYASPEPSQQILDVSRPDDASPRPLRTNQHPRRAVTIGRHAISLNTQELQINTHLFNVTDYTVASHLFDDLLKYRDRLDRLDRAITTRGPESEWFGIPGWRVHSNGISMHTDTPTA